jgi:hypothetical protein
MKRLIHRISAIIATLCIGTFFVSSIVVELFASPDMVATVKRLIVFPGLFILVPSIALTGATGFSLTGKRKGGLVDIKKKRMPFIAMNGLLVLVPAAIFLNHLASAYSFTWAFYLVQGLELIAGAINLTLMSLNMRDGLKLTGKSRYPQKQPA